MKKMFILFIVSVMMSVMFSAASYAQQGWGPASPYGRMYNPKTVETVSGEVTSVETFSPSKGGPCGVHLMVKTEKGTTSVHLGPQWYMENQEIKIAAKDKIEVKGSKVTFEGKPALLAAEVRKGEYVLKLRDEKGFPMWSGWRRWQNKK
jgi:hypothetical protein